MVAFWSYELEQCPEEEVRISRDKRNWKLGLLLMAVLLSAVSYTVFTTRPGLQLLFAVYCSLLQLLLSLIAYAIARKSEGSSELASSIFAVSSLNLLPAFMGSLWYTGLFLTAAGTAALVGLLLMVTKNKLHKIDLSDRFQSTPYELIL